MMAMKKMQEQGPSEIELLLPWHAAGTLNARDAGRVEDALAGDPELARQFAVIQDEYAATIGLNESLGAPSSRAMQKLFDAIDREPSRAAPASFGFGARISTFLASLSPRTLAWSAGLGALALMAQAGVIGAVLMRQPASFQTASLSMNAPSSSAQAAPRALVRFAPEARVADITALLDTYHASIIDGAKAGLFQLQFGDKAMTKDDVTALINRLQQEKIVSLAVAAP